MKIVVCRNVTRYIRPSLFTNPFYSNLKDLVKREEHLSPIFAILFRDRSIWREECTRRFRAEESADPGGEANGLSAPPSPVGFGFRA